MLRGQRTEKITKKERRKKYNTKIKKRYKGNDPFIVYSSIQADSHTQASGIYRRL